MKVIDLNDTKHKLAIIFALIVFLVSFFLELSYFTIRYNNFLFSEKKDFEITTTQFVEQFQKAPVLYSIFISQAIRFRVPKEDFQGTNKWVKYLDFLVLNKNGDIILQNVTDNYKITYKNIWELSYNHLTDLWNGMYLKKMKLIEMSSEFSDIVFIKKLSYPFHDYVYDLLFFFLITLCFSVWFYYIGRFFVNKNLRPVQESLSDMNDFTHNASHELKTPLSVISSNLQLLQTIKVYDEELIVNSLWEIKRIDSLLQELSNFSDINSMWILGELDIQKEIWKILEEYNQEIEKKHITIYLKVHKKTVVKANEHYFYILFSNLLRNAIRYNYEYWNIDILLEKNKISISNTGKDIDPKDLPYIFKRFFKGERSRTSEGFWIWLSLVKKVCDLYKWKIFVTSVNGYTSFEIRF